MRMLDDITACATAGARGLTVLLFAAGASMMTGQAVNAKSRAKADATPPLDAQAINAVAGADG
jgi:hypothetical protein